MTFRFLTVLVATSLHVSASAGEEIVFKEVPEWVAEADFDAARAAGEKIVLYDRQVRFNDSVVYTYSDNAWEMRSQEDVQNFGTLRREWLPDKGDLIVHRVSIWRNGQEIDVIEGGGEFDVIRREEGLEQRLLDGVLTAVMAVPGLAVGDVLRITTTNTVRDQALNGEMQASEGMYSRPAKLGFGRIRMSYPKSLDARWRSIGQAPEPKKTSRGGFNYLEIEMPIAAPKEMPNDAPGRFQTYPLIQLTSYRDWAHLARSKAPLYSTDGWADEGTDIAAEVARIMAAAGGDLERAALALQTVQDDVSYLLDGLDGGNYLPQSPKDTWALRYGDCKAKTLLLLTMLHAMDIEAVPVLVHTESGDVAQIAQAQPSVFNHVVVMATINGEEFWLDGTAAGARMSSIHEVPDFRYGLPLDEATEGLIKLTPRFAKKPDRKTTITYDLSGGADLPVSYTATIVKHGINAASWRKYTEETDERAHLMAINREVADVIGQSVTYDGAFSYDDETGQAVLTAKGFLESWFQQRRDQGSIAIPGETIDWGFNPKRARSTWREIPFSRGGPYWTEHDVTFILPQDGANIRVSGEENVDAMIAGVEMKRQISRGEGMLRMVDSYRYLPSELDSEAIRQGRRDMRRHSSNEPKITFEQPLRYWHLSDSEITENMSGPIAGFANFSDIFGDDEPTVAASLDLAIAMFKTVARDYEGALVMIDSANAKSETSEALLTRAEILDKLRRYDDALKDAEKAYFLDGSQKSASVYAEFLFKNDRAEDAMLVLDELGLTGDEARGVTRAWAQYSGGAGQLDDGWQRLEDALFDRPEDASLLNAQCWMMGTWEYRMDQALEVCDNAVKWGGYRAGYLDSRALVKYRQGDLDGAMEDLNAALKKSPETDHSLYLRGIIRLERGDRGGREDILHALRITPSLQDEMTRYGVTVPS